MSKSLSRVLYLFGILCWIIGGLLLAYSLSATVIRATGVIQPRAHIPWTIAGGAIFFAGCVLSLIAWIGALARTAQLGRWAWFVCLIIIPFIGLLCYIFVGPKTPSRPAPGSMTRPPPRPSYGS